MLWAGALFACRRVPAVSVLLLILPTDVRKPFIEQRKPLSYVIRRFPSVFELAVFYHFFGCKRHSVRAIGKYMHLYLYVYLVQSLSITVGVANVNERVYDDMLRAGKRIFCTATDDGHGKGSMCGCYIMVKAEMLEYKSVIGAIMRGDFYSSEGPEIKSLYFEDGKVTIETSEAAEIRFTTGIRKSKRFLQKDGEALTTATYELPADKDPYYFRVTVTDKNGKHAYTNAYFMDELR